MLMYWNMANEDDLWRLDGLNRGHMYVLVVESKLKGEALPLVEGALRALEVYMPEGEVIIGQDGFQLLVILLD
jgi:hypothetical protein